VTGLAEILAENSRLREVLESVQATLETKELLLSEKQSTLQEKDQILQEKDQVIASQQKALCEKEQLLAKREAMVKALTERAEELAQALEQIILDRDAPASQRFVPNPNQIELPFPHDIEAPPRSPVGEDEDEDGESEDSSTEQDDDSSSTDKPRNKKKNRGKQRRRNRQAFAHLLSRVRRCPAKKGEVCFSCKKPLSSVGVAKSFRIEWVPGHFIVEDVEREQCACADPECEEYRNVLTVPSPYALPRAMCGNMLLAKVITDKFCDHIPLNRQARRIAREGFEVSTGTLARWILSVGNLLKIVALAVQKDVLKANCLQGDDTGYPVQDQGNGALRKGRMWVFTDQEQAYYAYTNTKEGKYPTELLDGFTGELLLVDGGSEFNDVVRTRALLRAGCWSHLRTYFYKARHHHPGASSLALGTIHDLFMIERTLKELSPDERVRERKKLSKPLVDGLFQWIKLMLPKTRKKSILGDALRYAKNQEKELRLFLENGEIPLHNNLSELLLRQEVVGRKNWLFSRSEEGAKISGYLYTLIGSCFLQGIDPQEYLEDILSKIQDHPASKIGELTPKAWKVSKELKKSHTESAG